MNGSSAVYSKLKNPEDVDHFPLERGGVTVGNHIKFWSESVIGWLNTMESVLVVKLGVHST